MKFEEALIELRKGKTIICVSKGGLKLLLNKDSKIEMSSCIEVMDIGIMELIINGEWFIEEEPGKSFPEVFEYFKAGKKIRRKQWREDFFICIYNRVNNIDGLYELLKTDWEIIE